MTENCAHHWVYQRPDGPTSIGVCKKCGVEAEHWNTLDQGGASYGWGTQMRRMARVAREQAVVATKDLARQQGGRIARRDAIDLLFDRGIYKSKGSAEKVVAELLGDPTTWEHVGHGEYQMRKGRWSPVSHQE